LLEIEGPLGIVISGTCAYCSAMTSEKYTADYYLRGVESGLSNYQDYRFLPELTGAMAVSISSYLGIKKGDSLLDYGAARGYLVKCFLDLGVEAHGFDISEWAVSNCHPDVQNRISTTLDLLPPQRDWLLAKDCCEHIPEDDLWLILNKLLTNTQKGVLLIVPLSKVDGGQYVCPRDNQDATHVVRWTLDTWVKFLQSCSPDFLAWGGYHVSGIKQASDAWLGSCGFITALRRNTKLSDEPTNNQ